MGCIDLICANKSPISLNAVTFFNLNLLILSLISPLVCKLDYIQNLTFYTLINFRSMYCFIDTVFALKYKYFHKTDFTYGVKII